MRRALLFAAAACLASRASALTESKSSVLGPGTVRGSFLSRGVGARAVGMGEAFTAVADDASAVSWNPAGLGRLRSFGAVAMYDAAGEGLGLSYVAAAVPLGPGTAGASLTAMTYGSFTSYSDLGDRLGSEGFMDLGMSAAWGMPVGRLFGQSAWAGASVEFVRDAVGGSMAGFGAGLLVPVGEVLRAGAAVQHLGTSSDGYTLPAVARAGITARLAPGLDAGLEGAMGLYDRLATVAAGAEWAPIGALVLRGGYRQPFPSQQLQGLSGLTAGVGVRLGALGVDYAFQPYGELATSHRVSIVYAPASRKAEAVPTAESAPAPVVEPAPAPAAEAVPAPVVEPVPAPAAEAVPAPADEPVPADPATGP